MPHTLCICVCDKYTILAAIMPVICDSSDKMVCESNLSGAIREALSTNSGHQGGGSSNGSMLNGTDELNIQDRLIACAKRLLINKIEYEEAPSSSTTLYENLKSKYTVLKPGQQRTNQQNGVHNNTERTTTNGHSGTQQGELGEIFAEKILQGECVCTMLLRHNLENEVSLAVNTVTLTK